MNLIDKLVVWLQELSIKVGKKKTPMRFFFLLSELNNNLITNNLKKLQQPHKIEHKKKINFRFLQAYLR